MTSALANATLTLTGYCSLPLSELTTRLVTQGLAVFTELEGDFAIVAETDDATFIATSQFGVTQYYYTIHNGQLFHGATVLDVLRHSGRGWTWHWGALADSIQLDHGLANDTLHPDIHRVPQSTVLHWSQGQMRTIPLTPRFRESTPATPATALSAFNRSVATWATDRPVVAMSGGFDSRVILSALLREGVRPHLMTMGFPESTDVVIARAIAAEYSLPIDVVELRAEEYLTYGAQIVALTNGTKSAQNWHTFLSTRSAGLAVDDILLVGANGEYARTFYFDKGALAQAANFAPGRAIRGYWQRKLGRVFTPAENATLHPRLRDEFGQAGQARRVERLAALCHERFLPGLDRFYLEQRVRNFIGNGLKLYQASATPRLPFVDREWVSAIGRLGRGWKMGSNWHRYALAQNAPRLLDFPEEGQVAPHMAPRARPLYWAPLRKRAPVIGYGRMAEWFATDAIRDFIGDHAGAIEEAIPRTTSLGIIDEHRRTLGRMRAVSVLLSTIQWGDLVRQS
ncbi:MAG TPA: asparagine synthase-related protein [Thermomicrobiales bacterium]|jgi:asparagine synthase (glutamine-hydrolysing)